MTVADVLPTYLLPYSSDLENGGWTVIQRRVDDGVDFYRGWDDYATGFGNLNGSFWLGNERIHELTQACDNGAKLYIYLESFTPGDTAYAYYTRFLLSDSSTNYTITIEGYSGTSGGTGFFSGIPFTTRDQDHDSNDGVNCATNFKGGWWYNTCHIANLNGLYFREDENPTATPYAIGICWGPYKGYSESMRKTEWKIHC